MQGIKLEVSEEDFDYSKWLGPDWRNELAAFRKEKRVSTIVANHASGIYDVFTLMWALKGTCAFLASAHLKHVPTLG